MITTAQCSQLLFDSLFDGTFLSLALGIFLGVLLMWTPK